MRYSYIWSEFVQITSTNSRTTQQFVSFLLYLHRSWTKRHLQTTNDLHVLTFWLRLFCCLFVRSTTLWKTPTQHKWIVGLDYEAMIEQHYQGCTERLPFVSYFYFRSSTGQRFSAWIESMSNGPTKRKTMQLTNQHHRGYVQLCVHLAYPVWMQGMTHSHTFSLHYLLQLCCSMELLHLSAEKRYKLQELPWATWSHANEINVYTKLSR